MYVSFYDYEHVADGTTTRHSEGSSSYSGPGGSSSSSYVGDSTGSTHDEWHATTLSAWSVTVGTGGWPTWTLLGSVSDYSEVHSSSSGSTWTQTSTVNGVSSTTGGTYSSSSSTPSSSHTETGTVPGGPPTAPTYSGPDDADFDTLLTALATAAANAYTSPTTRAEATDAAIASFTALDDGGNPSTPSGAIYTALSDAPEGGNPPEGEDPSGSLRRGASGMGYKSDPRSGAEILFGPSKHAGRSLTPERESMGYPSGAIDPPAPDFSGRIHDRIPRNVPEHWDKQTIEEALDNVKKGLKNRKRQMDQHDGPDDGHNDRYREETQWKEKLEERLRQLEREEEEKKRRRDTQRNVTRVVGVGMIVAGVLILGGTVVEDILTGGAGTLDDPPSFATGWGMIGAGFAAL